MQARDLPPSSSSSSSSSQGNPPPFNPGSSSLPYTPYTDSSYPAVYADNANNYDMEAGGDVEIYMDDRKLDRMLRHGFVRKVYGIVAAQLAMTAMMVALFMTVMPVKEWMMVHGVPIMAVCLVGSLVTICYLVCAAGASQSYPSNYILLSVFTLCESVLVGYIAASYDATIVLQAFLATTVLVVGLVLFAFQTSYDFTSWVGAMFYVLLTFIVIGMIKALFWQSSTLEILFSGAMALIFCVYLVIDTQLLIGRGKIRLAQDDYILGALMIYLDVINLFIELLRLLDALRHN